MDWYPWGEEARKRARVLDRPLFISIGYATCHWCHVMERESFEDDEVASLLNTSFVSVKIDREEYPDVDHFYMSACTAGGRRGGWPLTILAFPDGKPFYAATYLSKHSAGGRLGLVDLLGRIVELWDSDRAPAAEAAEDLIRVLEASMEPSETATSDLEDRAANGLRASFDDSFGGFGDAPKFPTFHHLRFLMRHAFRTGIEQGMDMAERTLFCLRSGGIWDHVGFGFHRYATDRPWHLPHFEKMLYDQAMALCTYAEAWSSTKNTLFKRTCEELFDVLERDFITPDGLFYSAWDADSEGEEGKFYVWTFQELEQALSPEDLAFLCKAYGVRPEGNHLDEATGRPSGTNILDALGVYTAGSFSELSIGPGALDRFEPIREQLLALRAERIAPNRDEKVLLDWNAMTVAALAIAGRSLGNKEMMAAAARAGNRLFQVFSKNDGTWVRRRFERQVGIEAQLDDVAALAWACLELFQSEGDPAWFDRALTCCSTLEEGFWSASHQAFFISSGHDIPLRQIRSADEAYPSGAALALCVFSSMASLTGTDRYDAIRSSAVSGFGELGNQWPQGFTGSLTAPPAHNRGEIIVSGPGGLSDAIHRAFLPDHTTLTLSSQYREHLGNRFPFMESIPNDLKARATVCTGQVCGLPVSKIADVLEAIQKGT